MQSDNKTYVNRIISDLHQIANTTRSAQKRETLIRAADLIDEMDERISIMTEQNYTSADIQFTEGENPDGR